MLIQLINELLHGGNIWELLIHLLFSVLIILTSLSVHECAHAFAAYKLGDPTAKNTGRLTLNPMKHLDVAGFLCMLVAGFGWAHPVPVNARNFKKPRSGMAITAAAGPLSNLILAFIAGICIKILTLIPGPGIVIVLSYAFFYMSMYMNITLAVFNLLPVPPLDGSRLFYVFLPPKAYFGVMKYERYIVLGVMILLLTGCLETPISFVTHAVINLIFKAVGL